MTEPKSKRTDISTSDVDELLAKAARLKSTIAANAKERRSPSNASLLGDLAETTRSVAENLSFFRRLIVNITQGFLGFHERFLLPTWRLIGPPIKWSCHQYGRFWNRFAFYTDKSTGQRILSRTRAGVVVAASILFLSAFTPTTLGDAVRFFTIEPISDGVLMLASKRTDTFYLNQSEEIDPEGNVHSGRGCKHAGQCTEQDAAYFRVKPRLSHDIWKLLNYNNPIYVPDHVVAPIAPGVNRCEVTYYGYRMTSSWVSRLLRSLEFYPTMLEGNCTYLGNGSE